MPSKKALLYLSLWRPVLSERKTAEVFIEYIVVDIVGFLVFFITLFKVVKTSSEQSGCSEGGDSKGRERLKRGWELG